MLPADIVGYSPHISAENMRNLKSLCLKPFCGALFQSEIVARKLRRNLEEKTTWYTKDERRILESNYALRECNRGTPCFVIGNGPSLNKQNLDPLGNWLTFAMSGFWKHPIVEHWKPTYYCFADPIFFDRSEPMKRFFADMGTIITDTTYLLPLAARNAVLEQNLLQGKSAYYAGFQGCLHRSAAKQVDFTRPIPGVQSVSQFAILSAIYTGCSPIYLIGLDHDWLAQRGPDRHFYAGKTIEGHPIAHGDLDRYSYKHDLVDALKLWEGYERLAIIAATHDCEIINATNGGFLDVFPRENYEKVIGLRRTCAS